MKRTLSCSYRFTDSFCLLFALTRSSQRKFRVSAVWLPFSGPRRRARSFAKVWRPRIHRGQNITIEYRYAEGKTERLPIWLPTLCASMPTSSSRPTTTGAAAAKNATKTIPIVFYNVPIRLESGSSTAWRGPAGTSPACTICAPEISGKRLEILKETIPKLTRVAVIWDPKNPAHATWKETGAGAATRFTASIHGSARRRKI